MANRFWVGGAATWDGTAGSKWSTTSGGAGGSSAPTSADDVFFDSASGSVTVTMATGAVARSLDCTGFTGTVSHGSGFTLSLGDATAGAGGVALKFVAGMTYTFGSVTTSAITFASTSATQQTIDFGGKAHGNLSFSSGNYAITSALSQNKTASVTINGGTIAFDGVSNNSAFIHELGIMTTGSSSKNLNFGTAEIVINRDTTATVLNLSGSNTTLNTSSATFRLEAAGATTRIVRTCVFQTNQQIYRFIANGTGEVSPSSPITILDRLERNGNGYTWDQLNLTFNQTLTIAPGAVFKLNPSAGKRMTIWPSSNAIQANIRLVGATLDFHDVDFQDIGFDNGGENLDLSGVTGGSGDAGGNVMVGGGILTFTPSTTQTWNKPAGGSWSDAANWTSRVPLVQDNVVMNNSFTGSPTIDVDVKWFCRDISFAGGTGGVTLRSANYECYITGNTTLRSGVSLSNAASTEFMFAPRTSCNFAFNGAGAQFPIINVQSGNGGNLNFIDNGRIGFPAKHRSGPITIPSGVTIEFDTYQMNGNQAQAKSFMRVAGTLQLIASSGTALALNNAATFNEFVDLGGTIQLTNTSGSAKTINGNGASFPRVVFPAGAGGVLIQGSNSFAGWDAPAGAKITVTSGTVQTLRGSGVDRMANGTNVVTLLSSSAGSAATISKANGQISWDYLSVKDITKAGACPFFAGTNSTDVSGNTNVSFTAAPAYFPQAMAS
jgi:hypothetical protein